MSVMFRVLPLPPTLIPLAAIRFVLWATAVTVTWLSDPLSEMLNGIAPVEVSSATTTLVFTLENAGLELLALLTKIWKVRTVLGPPSEPVTVIVADPVAPDRTDIVIEPEVAPGV